MNKTLALNSFGANFSKQGILLDLKPPALIISKVEVHYIELELGHNVQMLLYILHRKKMPARVQMKTAVLETGIVCYIDCRYLGTGNIAWHELDQCRHSIEETSLISCSYCYLAITHLQTVTLSRKVDILASQEFNNTLSAILR